MSLTGSPSEEQSERDLLALLELIPDRIDSLPPRCQKIQDWDLLLRFADHEGVLGVLLWALEQTPIDIPVDAREWGNQRLRSLAMMQLQARATLHELLSTLQASGIRCAPFKGVAFADRWYPAGAIRPSADVDVLIDPENGDSAARVLVDRGFRVEARTGWAAYERWRHELKATRRGSTPIELHLNVNDSFGVHIPTSPILDRASTSMKRTAIVSLDRVDELVLVTVHAVSTLFLAAKWLMDVKLLVLGAQDRELESAVVRARELGISSAFEFGMRFVGAVTSRTPPVPSWRIWTLRHHWARLLRPRVKRSLAARKRSAMPIAHLLLTDSFSSWPRVLVFRAWDHIGRKISR